MTGSISYECNEKEAKASRVLICGVVVSSVISVFIILVITMVVNHFVIEDADKSLVVGLFGGALVARRILICVTEGCEWNNGFQPIRGAIRQQRIKEARHGWRTSEIGSVIELPAWWRPAQTARLTLAKANESQIGGRERTPISSISAQPTMTFCGCRSPTRCTMLAPSSVTYGSRMSAKASGPGLANLAPIHSGIMGSLPTSSARDGPDSWRANCMRSFELLRKYSSAETENWAQRRPKSRL